MGGLTCDSSSTEPTPHAPSLLVMTHQEKGEGKLYLILYNAFHIRRKCQFVTTSFPTYFLVPGNRCFYYK